MYDGNLSDGNLSIQQYAFILDVIAGMRWVCAMEMVIHGTHPILQDFLYIFLTVIAIIFVITPP